MDIYGTIGPACCSIDIMEAMFRKGMTGMRLNLSHTSLEEAAPQIRLMHEAARRAGVVPRLLIDMQGPELRTGSLKNNLVLTEGETVVLGPGGIRVPEQLMPVLRDGCEVHLDDGKIVLRTIAGSDAQELSGANTAADKPVKAYVIKPGTLASRKSIAVPGTDIPMPAMTEDDINNIRKAHDFGVTAVMQPFVRSRQDILDVRQNLDKYDCSDIKIFAKIENETGISRIEEIIQVSDEIVIARGDLGNNLPLWKVPVVQKNIAKACRKAGRPFMVVTQLLSSMEASPVPTRADISDVFNAVLDGASSLMITNESAVGRYPAEAVKYLVLTAAEAAEYMAVSEL